MKKIPTPREIKESLDKEIFGQEKAKKVLSFAFYLHLMRIHRKKDEQEAKPLPKSHTLILGSSGSGKRLMLNTLTSQFQLPFVRFDCTALMSGQSFNEVFDAYLRFIIQQFGEQATQAVIIFEDFDKIANRQNMQNPMSLEAQEEILTLIEQQERLIMVEQGKAPILFPTHNLMFIFSGRFNGIEPLIYMRSKVSDEQDEIIKRRDERLELIKKYKAQLELEKAEVKNKSIGFYTPDTAKEGQMDIKQAIEKMYHDLKENDLEAMVHQSFQNELIEAMNEELNDQSEILSKVGYQDFVNYGVIAELVGRIGFIAAFHQLGENEILQILKRPMNNIIDLYKNYFHLHQDSLEIKEEVYPLIAEEVAKRKIGTRSINTILVQLIQDLLFIAPDKKKDKFVIDAKYFHEKINDK